MHKFESGWDVALCFLIRCCYLYELIRAISHRHANISTISSLYIIYANERKTEKIRGVRVATLKLVIALYHNIPSPCCASRPTAMYR